MGSNELFLTSEENEEEKFLVYLHTRYFTLCSCSFILISFTTYLSSYDVDGGDAKRSILVPIID
jgi:hypothetical protein